MAERARNLIEKGEAEADIGRWESSSRTLAEAIGLLEGKEDRDSKVLLSHALRWKAFADCRLGRFKEGVQQARRAMDISGSIGDDEGEADALGRLGYIHWRKGDNDLALEFFEFSMKKAEGCGARRLVGRLKVDWGGVLSHTKRFSEAKKAFEEAVPLLREVGDISQLARAYNNLGSVLMDMKRFDEANRTFQLCLEVAEEANDTLRQGWAAMNIGACVTKMGQPERAPEFLGMALVHLEAINDKIGIGLTHLEYGLAYYGSEDMDMAEASLTMALEIFERLELPAEGAETNMTLGKVFMARKDNVRAADHLERAKELYEALGMRKEMAQIEDIIKVLGP